ncbi:hypothetical protein VTJ04DRAFT_5053 [Mycothermus thermophilus]|uniref:uncharacterized protein n=1 Tax=Humicola insolens TaxID=85995 RepID=UPI0037449D88
MGLPPAFLFVVRHGFRLDVADKQWHLSSPTPYDPPLTYGGWQQAQNVGVRIASILRDQIRKDELAASSDPTSTPRKRKRYRVVIHSSPFLRCIQTSIAISAGLARDSTIFVPSTTSTQTPQTPPNGQPQTTPAANGQPVKIHKSVLRLDAFLGEWLSPSYFELITPPPESVMMLASATADLLRREDYSHYPDIPSNNQTVHQGHLWRPTSRENSTASPPRPETPSSNSAQSAPTGYVAPVPHYAISTNNTIPPGFVSHARDACVAVDYQWHSNRSGLNWGDGGTFPEEWTSMHKRFRTGVQALVDWYSTAETPTLPVTKTVRPEPDADEGDVETEAVVILVSHGAGCNALIGAITHQPVLTDVGMASLTMAERKPDLETLRREWPADYKPKVHELYDLKIFANTDHLRSPPSTPTPGRSPASLSGTLNGIRGRHSSFSTSVNTFTWNDGYGPRGSAANSGLSSLRPPNEPRIPRLSFSHNTSGGITIGSGVTSFTSSRPSGLGRSMLGGSIGLWAPASTRLEPDDDEDDFKDFPFAGKSSTSAATTTTTSTLTGTTVGGLKGSSTVSALEKGVEKLDVTADGSNGMSKNDTSTTAAGTMSTSNGVGLGVSGLWSQPPRPSENDADRPERDTSASKRRWTVTERGGL